MATTFSPDARSGLTAEQVRRKRAQGRQNTPPAKVSKSPGQILKDHICTRFNLFNGLIALGLALVGAWSNLLFILVVALNTLIGIVQEFHAKKLVDRLSVLAQPAAQAVRDGAVVSIPLEELVEDDVLVLEAGSQVCTDAVVLSGAVEVNESLLTGESDPIPRPAGSRLLSGSFVVSGKCRARVEHVGVENYAARLTQQAKQPAKIHSALLDDMGKVTRLTGYLIPPLGVLLFAQALFLRGEPVQQAAVTTAAGLLGMLPKGLALLISIGLASGIAALSKKRVLVQQLYALETLAHVDTLCLDKTGTLTQGRMEVEEVLLTELGRSLPFAQIMGSFLRFSQDNNATFQALQAHFAPSEAFVPCSQVPFSSERKWSAATFPAFSFVVGAPEVLGGPPMADFLQKEFQAGKRILFAGITRQPVESGLPLPPLEAVASIVLTDPIRPSAAQTLAYFHKEGVALKLISGDNPAAVSALAAKAGFPGAFRAVDMSRLHTQEEICQAAERYAVFGRVSPQQKQQLVGALQQQGHSVAMTGDGVNDLLALRQADCSIAMGSGSDAARQLAQVVLLDSDFAALPDVLLQGRRVVNNITQVAGVFFIKTIYSLLLSILCLVLNIPFPFLPIQVTLIDLAIEGYPAFFLSFEPNGKKIDRPFLPTVFGRALPFALCILVYFSLCCLLPRLGLLPAGQAGLLFYLLVGMASIHAVYRCCRPPNPLRLFLCITMTLGFYAAVLLFHTVLHLPLPTPATLCWFLGAQTPLWWDLVRQKRSQPQ